jgi:polyphosphate kinase 2 (PPK2 family)
MLDQIDLHCTIGKRAYKLQLSELQARLYDMEQALLQARLAALVVFEGWAGTAKIGTISILTRRLDPRGLRVHPITPPRTYETQYPWLYRFWLKAPSQGQLAIFDRSWYREVLAGRTHGAISPREWRARCEDIVAFERQLADDGVMMIKFWLHISKKEQRRRFRKLLRDRLTAWQVTDEDRWQQRHYGRMRAAVEDMLARTDSAYAPWTILPATDKRYAHVAVLQAMLATLEARLGNSTALRADQRDSAFDASGVLFRRVADAAHVGDMERTDGAAVARTVPLRVHAALRTPPAATVYTAAGILHRVDLSQKLDQKTYDRTLMRLQAKIHLLGFQVYLQKRPVVLVFEGWDAAGKGGAIHRITEKLDPRGYVVHAIGPPAGDDKVHHYLYRFWRRLPPRGMIAVFDRSWYGRVLVERVEGFASEGEWQRAYAEINEFERQLVEFGTIVCKFWLHLSQGEQLRRFEERQNVPYKAWKLTGEDWRNRGRWPEYEQAADEMLLRTSTPAAPWTIVEAEDKRFARIKVLRTLVRRLEDELGKIEL